MSETKAAYNSGATEGDVGKALDLAAIQARVDAATKGPWRVYSERQPCEDVWQMMGAEDSAVFGCDWVDYEGGGNPPSDADGDFIAHSWQDVRNLLAEVARLREENARLRAERAWISVDDRLPERGRDEDDNYLPVLAYWRVGIIARAIYDDGGWKFADSISPFGPTHWMPLPEPPTG